MKQTLIPCREKGCKHELFPTPNGERMHYHRVHSKRVPDPAARSITPAAFAGVEPARVDRRTREWRLANPKVAKAIGSQGVPKKKKASAVAVAHAHTEAKFCPCCGFNLVIFNMALTLAKKYAG